MKTNNFTFDLMVPNQEHKDITFNEALLKIDQFLSNSINGFIDNTPEKINVGEKFIISQGEKKDYICFKTHESKNIEFLKPINNMIIFSNEHQCFFTYNNDYWNQISNFNSHIQSSNQKNPKSELREFIGIQDQYLLPKNISYHYLYVSEDCELMIAEEDINTEITLIIKQHYSSAKSLTLPYNILWEDKVPYKTTSKANHMDVVKLFRIPGSFHFLGKIIAQNLTF